MEHARRTRLTKIGRARYLEVVAHVVAEVSRDNGRRGLWGQRRNGPVLAGVLAAKAVGAQGRGRCLGRIPEKLRAASPP